MTPTTAPGRSTTPVGAEPAAIVVATPPPQGIASLLDARTRRAIKTYSMLGYVGYLFCELMAYTELLEEEIAKRDAR